MCQLYVHIHTVWKNSYSTSLLSRSQSHFPRSGAWPHLIPRLFIPKEHINPRLLALLYIQDHLLTFKLLSFPSLCISTSPVYILLDLHLIRLEAHTPPFQPSQKHFRDMMDCGNRIIGTVTTTHCLKPPQPTRRVARSHQAVSPYHRARNCSGRAWIFNS